MRRLTFLAALAALLAVVGVVGAIAGRNEDVAPPRSALSTIAFVTQDGEIWTTSLDGVARTRLSPGGDGYYTWPTWSPDGRALVFSGATGAGPGDVRVALYESRPVGERPKEVFATPPGFFVMLADGVLHYPLWSPDSKRLAFIAATEKGLTLYLGGPAEPGKPVAVLDQGPLWLAWSPDSRFLMAHRGSDQLLVDIESGYTVRDLDFAADGYRVPAWQPGADRVAFVAQDGPLGLTMFLSDPNGLARRRIRSEAGQASMLWSPSGDRLAVHSADTTLDYYGQPLLVGRGLTFYSPIGEPLQPQVPEPMVALFWSPDGSRIAYVSLPDQNGVLRWVVLDIATGQRRIVAEFQPSPSQIAIFQFFDQYAYSHSPWSPDGKHLLFAGRLWRDVATASASQPLVSQIIVVPVDSPGQPKAIAQGILAFWAPR